MLANSRRSILAASVGLPPLLAAAAGQAQGTAAEAPPRRGGTLRISVDQAAAVINPLLTRVNPEHLVCELLYSNLTKLRPDMTAEPDLAASWTANADLTEWRFTLRAGVRFHDGTPCTAADVAATFAAILDPRTGSPARAILAGITAVVAEDPATVLVRTAAPAADLPVTVAHTNTRIVPAAIAAGDPARLARAPLGTGPFTLVSYEPDRLIVLARNDGYFIPGQPYLDRVEIRVYPDNSAETSALIAGDNDLMVIASHSEFDRLRSARGVTALQTPSGQFLNVNMACDQPPFNDVRVRRALSLAIDRDALVGFVALGHGRRGDDVPMNAAYHFHKPQPAKRPNLAEARRLLAEAGHPGGLDLTLVASENPGTRAQLALALREMARPAGFRITVETMPHARYLEQVWRKGAFYVGFYNTQATADDVFKLLYTSNAAWNETRWNNAAFDAVVAEARSVADEDRRRALYATAQDMMYAEVPSVIPVFFDLLAARRNHVRGFVHHPRGQVFRLERVWLDAGAPRR